MRSAMLGGAASRSAGALAASLGSTASAASSAVAAAAEESTQARDAAGGNSTLRGMQVPISPLELEFISGPRMGERVTLFERFSTLGRAEGSTIQVSDPVLSNISRTHCIFEYIGNRWYLRDNASTNGTWRRLSCVLQPSRPQPLQAGVSILAGVHEFQVEEVEMQHCWAPSAAVAALEDLSKLDQVVNATGGAEV